MKKRILILLCMLIGSMRLDGADLIAVLVCDTHAENIESAVKADLKTMQAEANRIALNTDLNLREVVFVDQDVKPKNFLTKLKLIPVTQDDVVLFYYSGHGYRTSSKDGNPWPNLFFTPAKQGVDFNEVSMRLLKKKPRLLVSIADCCNNYMPDGGAPPVYRGELFGKASSRVMANYQELFLNTSGLVMVSSSEVGELSWCISRGALFTLALIDSLKIETQKIAAGNASWQTVLDRASFVVRDRQTPMYVIEEE